MDPRRARREEARRRTRRRRIAVAAAVLALAGAGVALAVALTRGGGGAPAATAPAAARPPAPRPAPARPHRPAPVPLAFPARPARASVRVPVLMFHRVAPLDTVTNAVSRDLTIAPATFDAEMAWLARKGYHPIRQAQLFRALFMGAPLPAKPVVLTFDDGYVDATTAVAPQLRRRGWPATFYVITGRVGERAFLTWPEVKALDREGMDVASHTVDHVQLPTLPESVRTREIVDSKRVLEQRLGHPVYWFAYPAGRYDDASAAALRRAGYLLSFTTDPGSSIASATPETEPRVRVHGADSVAQFAQIVTSAAG